MELNTKLVGGKAKLISTYWGEDFKIIEKVFIGCPGGYDQHCFFLEGVPGPIISTNILELFDKDGIPVHPGSGDYYFTNVKNA